MRNRRDLVDDVARPRLVQLPRPIAVVILLECPPVARRIQTPLLSELQNVDADEVGQEFASFPLAKAIELVIAIVPVPTVGRIRNPLR